MGIGSRLHVVLSELFASHLKIGQKLLIPLYFSVLTSEKVCERKVMEWSESFSHANFGVTITPALNALSSFPSSIAITHPQNRSIPRVKKSIKKLSSPSYFTAHNQTIIPRQNLFPQEQHVLVVPQFERPMRSTHNPTG